MLPHYYRYGSVSKFLPDKYHSIGGTSLDFYAEINIPFVYNVELPDLGQNGFLIGSNEIPNVGFLPSITIQKPVFLKNMLAKMVSSFKDEMILSSIFLKINQFITLDIQSRIRTEQFFYQPISGFVFACLYLFLIKLDIFIFR